MNVIDTNLYSTIKDQWTTEDKYDLNETMDHTEDYSIEIKATGKRAYLSVITVDYTRKCNQCFLGIAQDYSPKIKSYKLDDVVQFSSSISIYK